MQNYQNLNDDEFLAALANASFPAEQFTHLCHIRLAVICFRRFGFEPGLNRLAQIIQDYAQAIGAAEKYHATITYACYRIVVERICAKPNASWQDLKLMLSDFQASGQELVAQYYSDFILSTNAAKKNMLLPDLQPFASDAEYSIPPFEWIEGDKPLIISMPHNGTCIAPEIKNQMRENAFGLADTDWYLRLLYDFAVEEGYSLLCPLYSRYVIDLNRDTSGESLYPGANTTELCPTSQFDLQPLYLDGQEPSSSEIERRVSLYWQPYHQQIIDKIADLRQKHGQILLFEAHSIAQQVPRFFDGNLPDFNFGTNGGKSCGKPIQQLLAQFDTKAYSKVIDGRFKGGYITRQYAQPEQGIHTVQLELSQATYLKNRDFQYNLNHSLEVQAVLRKLLSDLCATLA